MVAVFSDGVILVWDLCSDDCLVFSEVETNFFTEMSTFLFVTCAAYQYKTAEYQNIKSVIAGFKLYEFTGTVIRSTIFLTFSGLILQSKQALFSNKNLR